ncbi:MAG: TauD/TfdA family dioxygenase [Gammaproteobacteria bacterium]|nr:TauD/TfdA family dioxygenase [Gammaproteobacteria bacterium]
MQAPLWITTQHSANGVRHYIFDVRTSTEQTSLAYTAMELPLHADLCTREHMPGLQFLHCIENSTTGGASMLGDGFQLARLLAERSAEDFEALSTIPITFYNKANDTDYRWSEPLIGLDAAGDINEIRFSPWLRAPVTAPSMTLIAFIGHSGTFFCSPRILPTKCETTLKPGELPIANSPEKPFRIDYRAYRWRSDNRIS